MALKIVKSRVAENLSQAAHLNLPIKDDPIEAIRLLELVFQANPGSDEVFATLESLCREHEQRETLRRVLVARLHHAHDPEALNRLGVLLFEDAEPVAAIRCFETAQRMGSEAARDNLKQVQRAKRGQRRSKTIAPEIHGLLKRLQPKLSACLIVKDEERFLAQCLESLKGVADEIIVVDTGSTDETVKIAKRHGAKVFHFDWIDDFSAARNHSLSQATGDWILIIDADEHLAPESKEKLRQAISVPAATSYFIQLDDQADESASNVALLPRLFRRAEGAIFTGRIHEQITPQLQKLGYVDRQESSIRLIHKGYRQEIIQERGKRARNLALLERQLAETPDDHYIQFQLGKEYRFEGKNLDRAFELLSAACQGIPNITPLPPSGAEAFYQLAHVLYLKDQVLEAIPVCRKGVALYPDYPDTRYLLGRFLLEEGRAVEALEQFRKCRDSHGAIFISGSDVSYTSWRALWGEGSCLLAMGQPLEAIKLLEQAQGEAGFASRAIALELSKAYSAIGDHRRALAELYAFSAEEFGVLEWVRIAESHLKLGEYPEALDSLERAETLEGFSAEAHRLKGECLLWLGRLAEAREAFTQALVADPERKNAISGLVACHLIMGECEEAARLMPLVDAALQGLYALLQQRAMAALPPLSDASHATWSLLCRHALAADRMDVPEALISFALDNAERYPLLCRQLAAVLLGFGAAELALELLQKALPVSEREAEHLGLMGQALESLGDADLAREAYQACVVLEPRHDLARARLMALRA